MWRACRLLARRRDASVGGAVGDQPDEEADVEVAMCEGRSSCDRAAVGQPVLRTARLLLTPLTDDHFELEVELDSDPEVLRYIWGRALSRDEVRRWHDKRMALGREVDGLGYWVAALGGEFVGLMMLPPAGPGRAELGYRLARRWWRRGTRRN